MKKEVKKILAGLGVAGLISAGGISLPGHAAAGSGWGANKDSAVSAEKQDAEKAAEAVEEAAEEMEKAAEEEIPAKKPAKSGWGGWYQRAVCTCIV